MSTFVDRTGLQYGRLTCLNRYGTGRKTAWLCKCICGNEIIVRTIRLTNKNTRSCGCLQRETMRINGAKHRLPPGKGAEGKVWGYYKRNTKLRGLTWTISRDVFNSIILLPCVYCGGEKLTTTHTTYGDSLRHNGIDRTDNSKGYVHDNIVPCCKQCNMAKHAQSPSEFEGWLDRIVKFRSQL